MPTKPTVSGPVAADYVQRIFLAARSGLAHIDQATTAIRTKPLEAELHGAYAGRELTTILQYVAELRGGLPPDQRTGGV